jgi:hypothetical protein
MDRDEDLHPGDDVEWNTSQGTTHGEVKRKVTEQTKVGGTTLKGWEDDPVYIVKSDKSGKQAGHHREALRKRS